MRKFPLKENFINWQWNVINWLQFFKYWCEMKWGTQPSTTGLLVFFKLLIIKNVIKKINYECRNQIQAVVFQNYYFFYFLVSHSKSLLSKQC